MNFEQVSNRLEKKEVHVNKKKKENHFLFIQNDGCDEKLVINILKEISSSFLIF